MRILLKEFQNYCLNHHVTFVSYKFPGSNSPVTLFSSEKKIYNSISEIDCDSGFLLSPFQSENLPVIVILDNKKVSGWEINLNELPHSVEHPLRDIKLDQNITLFPEYVDQITDIKRSISLGNAEKVVLSRIKMLYGINHFHLPCIFEDLARLYSHAFIFLVYSPDCGIWLGATPETLVQTGAKKFSTMALAGTKKFAGNIINVNWTDKEIKEHEYVAKYIREKLSAGGYRFAESERQTIRAGNVVHLFTTFEGKIGHHKQVWKDMVTLLYPTPAICGIENESALRIIRKLEKHNREYYAGIIGTFNAKDGSNLFVTLRCMKVSDNSALLFAGGGILSGSSAIKEWEETELKFNTLIHVIEKVKEKIKTG